MLVVSGRSGTRAANDDDLRAWLEVRLVRVARGDSLLSFSMARAETRAGRQRGRACTRK